MECVRWRKSFGVNGIVCYFTRQLSLAYTYYYTLQHELSAVTQGEYLGCEMEIMHTVRAWGVQNPWIN